MPDNESRQADSEKGKALAIAVPDRGRDDLRRAVRIITQNPLTLLGVAIFLAVILASICAPLLTPYNPVEQDLANPLLAPSGQHLTGTDEMGRDLFTRILYGGRISLQAAALVIIMAGGIGTILGCIAGYYGRVVDELIMRTSDLFLAFPGLVLAIAIATALGPSLENALIAISLVWWPWYARLLRGQVLSMKQSQYVEAALSLGASDGRVLFRHILPNCVGPLTVQVTLDAGAAILSTASLSFIGVGAQPPTPEWGALIAVGREYMLSQWWYPTFPGFAILLTVLGLNLMGEPEHPRPAREGRSPMIDVNVRLGHFEAPGAPALQVRCSAARGAACEVCRQVGGSEADEMEAELLGTAACW